MNGERGAERCERCQIEETTLDAFAIVETEEPAEPVIPDLDEAPLPHTG